MSSNLAKIFGKSGQDVRVIVREPTAKPVVPVAFYIFNLPSIDCVAKSFRVTFQANLEWRPTYDEAVAWAADRVNFSPHWEPKLYWKNAVEVSKAEAQVYGELAATIDRRTTTYIHKHSEASVQVGSVLFDRRRQIIVKSPTGSALLTHLLRKQDE